MRQGVSLILVIVILLLGGCGSPAPEVEAPAKEEGEVIAQWAGRGARTTEPFIIESDAWAIKWVHIPAVINEQTIGTFELMVYNVEKPDIPAVIAANSQAQESEVFDIEGGGEFYLMINSANSRWLVRVLVTPEEGVD